MGAYEDMSGGADPLILTEAQPQNGNSQGQNGNSQGQQSR
jgi:hypothetical protein